MNRIELFNLAWAEPVSKISARFGLSDRGLAKLCARHHIPLPERGYWARVKAGQYPARKPLPRPDHDYVLPLREPATGTARDNEPARDLQGIMQTLLHSARPIEGVAHLAASIPGPAQTDAPIAAPKSGPRKSTAGVACSGPAAPAAELPPPPVAVAATPLMHNGDTSPKLPDFRALDAECERAIAAGMEYQRGQAANALLSAVASAAHSLDESTSAVLLSWVRAVHHRLSQRDPVAAVIGAVCANGHKVVNHLGP